MTIRVLVVDDSEVIRDGIVSWLSGNSSIEIVGIAVNGLDAIEKAKELNPDIVIMDVQMPQMDGLEAAILIKEAMPQVGIIFLSAFADHMESCAEAGGSAYMLKDCDPDDLVNTVIEVFNTQSDR